MIEQRGAGSSGAAPRTCPTCKTPFVPSRHPNQRFCSKLCRGRKLGHQPPTEAERARLREKSRRRGQHHPKVYYTYYKPRVLERDHWLCQMPVCKQPTRAIPRQAPRVSHPLSATADLIVPKSLGGSDTDMDNLRAAHFGCNASRGNRPQRAQAYDQQERNSRSWLTG